MSTRGGGMVYIMGRTNLAPKILAASWPRIFLALMGHVSPEILKIESLRLAKHALWALEIQTEIFCNQGLDVSD